MEKSLDKTIDEECDEGCERGGSCSLARYECFRKNYCKINKGRDCPEKQLIIREDLGIEIPHYY